MCIFKKKYTQNSKNVIFFTFYQFLQQISMNLSFSITIWPKKPICTHTWANLNLGPCLLQGYTVLNSIPYIFYIKSAVFRVLSHIARPILNYKFLPHFEEWSLNWHKMKRKVGVMYLLREIFPVTSGYPKITLKLHCCDLVLLPILKLSFTSPNTTFSPIFCTKVLKIHPQWKLNKNWT